LLDYRLVETFFNRIFPVSSMSFFCLPCLVIFALNYVSVSFDISEIHVHCRTVWSVVDCVKFSVLVNQCVRPSCSLGGYTYPQKNKAGHSPYNVSFLFYETWFCCLAIFIRYFGGLTLFSMRNIVVL
jgi:hypothetical protein